MLDFMVLAQIAAEAAEKKPESLTEAIVPAVTILSLLYAGWSRIRAARLSAMLKAAAVGVKAYLDALPSEAEREDVKATIKAAAVAAGVNEELKREVRKATAEVKVPGPFPERGGTGGAGASLSAILVGLVVLALAIGSLLVSGGCVTAEVHEAALTAQIAVQHLHDSSVPDPAWLAANVGKSDGKGGVWTEERLRAVWAEEWAALERAQGAIERGTR